MNQRNSSKFQRCSICNFGAYTPSQYISDHSSRSNKVVYNQVAKEHLCLECEKGIGFKKKPLPKFRDSPAFEIWGEVALIDEDFDTTEVDLEFSEKKSESN